MSSSQPPLVAPGTLLPADRLPTATRVSAVPRQLSNGSASTLVPITAVAVPVHE